MKKLAFLPLLMASLAFAQDAEITFSSSEVEPGIFMVEARGGFGGGNMAVLVGEDHVAMIDDGLPPLAENLLAHVTETAGGPIDFADNGTVVFAHDNIRKRLLADSSAAGGPGGLPVITFGDGVTFHLGKIEARVKHMPRAHTDGDAVIHFPGANVIHTGDILFHGIFPFIDLDNGGTVDGYIAAQQEILSMANDETKIIPGHGALTDKDGMQADIDVLIAGRAMVKALLDQGNSSEAVLEANPLAKYESYSWQFITTERMTRTLIRSLTTD